MKPLYTIFFILALAISARAQWQPVPVPTGEALFSFAFTDSLHGYVSGDGVILRTLDGGENWETVYSIPPFNYLTDLCFPDPGIGYVTGNNLLLRTSDAGSTWTSLAPPTSVTLRGIYFRDSLDGFICGQGEEIWRTRDGAVTWEQSSQGIYWLRQFSFPTPDTGYCVGDGLTVYRTVDGGSSWQWMSGGGYPNLTDVAFVSADTGYVCGLDGYVAVTYDAGVTWFPLSTGSFEGFEGLWAFDGQTVMVVGSSGVILKTCDGGATWTPENSGTDTMLRNLYFLDATHGLIAGHYGTLLSNSSCPVKAGFTCELDGISAYFTDSSSCNDIWWWDFGDGYYSDLQNPWHMYDVEGNYTVCLTVTDTVLKVSDTSCEPLKVVLTATGNRNREVMIYPNPCSTEFTLSSPSSSLPGRIVITNLSGMITQTVNLNPDGSGACVVRIDLREGLYVVTGIGTDGVAFRAKLMVYF